MEFAGEFETHVTVQLANDADATALREFAAKRSLKFTHIVLAKGESASQPMVTREGRGTLSGELAQARDVAAALEGNGFRVSRVKTEASPRNQDIPQSESDEAWQSPDRYFESHVKVVLEAKQAESLDALMQLALQHAAHVSRNALRARDDGWQARFITQRCRRVGQPVAKQRLAALLDDLSRAGYSVLEVEEEFVVYDSNLALDAGWMQT
jgi:hypothetical protein